VAQAAFHERKVEEVVISAPLRLAATCLLLTVLPACAGAGPAVPNAVWGDGGRTGGLSVSVALLKAAACGEGEFPADEPLRALGCAGTLIAGARVLTPAHCVSNRPFYQGKLGAFPPPFPAGDLCVYRPEPFVSTADPDMIIAAVRRGNQTSDLIH
jgi:hypothetical protein